MVLQFTIQSVRDFFSSKARARAALLRACRNGDVETIGTLLERGRLSPSYNEDDKHQMYYFVLYELTREKKLDVLQAILSLHTGKYKPCEKCADLLLANVVSLGVDPDVVKMFTKYPHFRNVRPQESVIASMRVGSKPIVEHLLSLPAAIVKHDFIIKAASMDREDLFELLYSAQRRNFSAYEDIQFRLMGSLFYDMHNDRTIPTPTKYLRRVLKNVRFGDVLEVCVERNDPFFIKEWLHEYRHDISSANIDRRDAMMSIIRMQRGRPYTRIDLLWNIASALAEHFKYEREELAHFLAEATQSPSFDHILNVLCAHYIDNVGYQKLLIQPLLNAAEWGDANMIRELLKWGASPADQEHEAVSIACRRAIREQYTDSAMRIVAVLLNAGGDLTPFLQNHPSAEDRARFVTEMMARHNGVMLSWYRRSGIASRDLEERTQLLGGPEARKLFKDYQLEVLGRALKGNPLSDDVMHHLLQFSYQQAW